MLYIAAIVFAVFIASVGQILLKISANKTYPRRRGEYINIYVGVGYFLFLCSMAINALALRILPLSYISVFESMGFVFVLLLSRVVLKEPIGKRKLAGICAIIAGIMTYYLF